MREVFVKKKGYIPPAVRKYCWRGKSAPLWSCSFWFFHSRQITSWYSRVETESFKAGIAEKCESWFSLDCLSCALLFLSFWTWQCLFHCDAPAYCCCGYSNCTRVLFYFYKNVFKYVFCSSIYDFWISVLNYCSNVAQAVVSPIERMKKV